MCRELAPLFHGRSSRRVLDHTASPGLYSSECYHGHFSAPAWVATRMTRAAEIEARNWPLRNDLPPSATQSVSRSAPPHLPPIATRSAELSQALPAPRYSPKLRRLSDAHTSRGGCRAFRKTHPPSPLSSPTTTIARAMQSSAVSYASYVAGERARSTFAPSSGRCRGQLAAQAQAHESRPRLSRLWSLQRCLNQTLQLRAIRGSRWTPMSGSWEREVLPGRGPVAIVWTRNPSPTLETQKTKRTNTPNPSTFRCCTVPKPCCPPARPRRAGSDVGHGIDRADSTAQALEHSSREISKARIREQEHMPRILAYSFATILRTIQRTINEDVSLYETRPRHDTISQHLLFCPDVPATKMSSSKHPTNPTVNSRRAVQQAASTNVDHRVVFPGGNGQR
uniref:Uncharacterized protein n=1 Tax=Mycena chlorophos TaxID=658473 RepID=A0ABQ0KVB2_MYCCL|nr:predicted protein [Mycena chlorophos]